MIVVILVQITAVLLVAIEKLDFEGRVPRLTGALLFQIKTLLLGLIVAAVLVRSVGRIERDATGKDGFLAAAGLGDLDLMITLVLQFLGRRRDTDANTGSGNNGARTTFPTFKILD